MMTSRRFWFVCGLLALFPALGPAQDQKQQADWIDLMPGKNLAGWKRVPIPPDLKLTDKKVWSLADNGKILVCNGVGVKEMLLCEKELGDGVFHLEWRFKKVPDQKFGYNGGVYVRNSLNGQTWHQIQLAHLEKAPFLGDIFYDKKTAGKEERIVVTGDCEKWAKGPGEWNAFDITLKGSEVTVAVNGKICNRWKDCPVERGHLGLQAEFSDIEFRNLKFQPR